MKAFIFAIVIGGCLAAPAQTPAPAEASAHPSPPPVTIPSTGFAGLDNYRASRIAVYTDDYGQLARYRDAEAALDPPAPGEDRVVFFGDSITDIWNLPESFPGKPYLNRGIGGQTTSQMLVRFRPDVLDLDPDVVVVLAGTHDVADNSGPIAPEAIEGNLASMAELAKAHGVRVVLASILPVADDKKDASGQPLIRTQGRPPATLRAINSWMADYARRNGFVYLDYAAATSDPSGAFRADLNDDGLHPNAAGYAVMAPLAE